MIGLAGCGNATTSSSQITVGGSQLTVYASQPPSASGGQSATDTLDAERLALKQLGARAGKFSVRLVTLDGRELSDNARTAIQDPTAIAYLGELQPGTSQVSVEILNQQGVLEISPADTAVYLTQHTAAVPGAPTSFYPAHSTYEETFARVVPNSGQEAKALVAEMQALHVSKLYVASDGQPYGQATEAGVKASEAGALFYGATIDSAAASSAARALLNGVSASLPSVRLFAPSGLYDDSFISGLSAATQQQLIVSAPGFLTKDLTAGGRKFVSDFDSAYGHDPATQAIFGYAAMQALLYVLKEPRVAANNRASVVAGFRSLQDPSSVLGTVSISGGDPSLAPFIFARTQGGKLVPFAKG
jgi:ABC-type branched-subunit amino acid transport system substrate-binding protein